MREPADEIRALEDALGYDRERLDALAEGRSEAGYLDRLRAEHARNEERLTSRRHIERLFDRAEAAGVKDPVAWACKVLGVGCKAEIIVAPRRELVRLRMAIERREGLRRPRMSVAEAWGEIGG